MSLKKAKLALEVAAKNDKRWHVAVDGRGMDMQSIADTEVAVIGLASWLGRDLIERVEQLEAAGAILLKHIYDSGIAYNNQELEQALAVFADGRKDLI